MITQTYKLNLIPNGQILIVPVSQYDVGRTISFELYIGASLYTVPGNVTASIDGTKPDNRGFSLSATLGTHTASFDTTKNMCAVPGNTLCEFRLMNGVDNIGTANFILKVERAGLADDVDISETELPAYIDAAERSALDSEAYAIGKRNGQDVTSSDPAYHNNSKYFSLQAGNSASSASGSASTSNSRALDSEAYAVGTRNGSDVPSSDPTYHNNSKYYAEDAAESAQSAAASVASGTQVRFYIQNGDMYVVQTIGGVEQQPVNLGALEGAAVQSFATVAAMNAAIAGGTVAEGALCCVQQNIVMADTTSY